MIFKQSLELIKYVKGFIFRLNQIDTYISTMLINKWYEVYIPSNDFSSKAPHTFEWITSSTFYDLIGKLDLNLFLGFFPTNKPSHVLLGIVKLGKYITIPWLTKGFRYLTLKWPNLRCHNQFLLYSTTSCNHFTYVVLIIVLKVMIFTSSDL